MCAVCTGIGIVDGGAHAGLVVGSVGGRRVGRGKREVGEEERGAVVTSSRAGRHAWHMHTYVTSHHHDGTIVSMMTVCHVSREDSQGIIPLRTRRFGRLPVSFGIRRFVSSASTKHVMSGRKRNLTEKKKPENKEREREKTKQSQG